MFNIFYNTSVYQSGFKLYPSFIEDYSDRCVTVPESRKVFGIFTWNSSRYSTITQLSSSLHLTILSVSDWYIWSLTMELLFGISILQSTTSWASPKTLYFICRFFIKNLTPTALFLKTLYLWYSISAASWRGTSAFCSPSRFLTILLTSTILLISVFFCVPNPLYK